MKLNPSKLFDKALETLATHISSALEEPKHQEAWPFPTGDIQIKPLTQQATEEGIRFIHIKDKPHRCTIAYRPASERGRMMEIAVAYVHPKDQYNKKHGAMLAAERFFNKETVTMPLRSKDNFTTYWNIVNAFGNMQ